MVYPAGNVSLHKEICLILVVGQTRCRKSEVTSNWTIVCGTHCNSDQKTKFDPIWVKIQEGIYCDEEHKEFSYKKKTNPT